MLDGSLAVVTGGASGIGAACCVELANSAPRSSCSTAPPRWPPPWPAKSPGIPVEFDVGDNDDIVATLDSIETELGLPDILVNSAGIIQLPLPPDEIPLSVWDDVVRINQRGTYLTCVAYGTRMAARKRGSIVNIASIAGMRSMPLHAYAPAKAAVISMTECLAAEWGPSLVRVNSVSPGYTRTPAIQRAIDRGERDPSRLASNAALGRLVEPVEVARVVAFLASPIASGVTGANIPVDCGCMAAMSWNPYGGLRTP